MKARKIIKRTGSIVATLTTEAGIHTYKTVGDEVYHIPPVNSLYNVYSEALMNGYYKKNLLEDIRRGLLKRI